MRKADRKSYVPLTQVMLKNLNDARQAADVGGIAAFRFLTHMNALPEGSKITSNKINNWLNSPPRTVNADEFAIVLQAFRDIAASPQIKKVLYAQRGPTISSKEGIYRQKITPELRDKVEKLKSKCKNLSIRKMLARSGAPNGLSATLFSAITSGKAETLHVKHVEHLERLFDHYEIFEE